MIEVKEMEMIEDLTVEEDLEVMMCVLIVIKLVIGKNNLFNLKV